MIATRTRIRRSRSASPDAVAMLHANARTLAMRVATLPEQEQTPVLASLFETLAAHGVQAGVVQCSMQGMLVAAGATCYYGDSDEDAQAAEAAGIEFVRVERFFGE